MKKLIAVVCASFLTLVGCGPGSTNTDTIKIGANFELTGAVSSYGSSELEGAKLALEEINAKGGVLGKQLSLVELDNKSDAAEVVSVATRLTTQEKVVATIGPATSGNAKAAITSANQAKVPLLSPSATSDDVTVDRDGKVQPYGFRLCFKDSFQGQVMAKFATENLKATKAMLIADNSNDYGTGLAKEFKAAFKGQIVGQESYTDTEKDFSAIITNIKNKDFDVLFIPGYYGQAGLIIKAAREAGISVPIIGADGFDSPELVNLAGSTNLNNVYYSAHYSSLSKDEKVTTFLTNFKAKYNKEPNAFHALAYDSVYLLADAITRADSATPAKITEALEATKEFKGVTGLVEIDEFHNAVKSGTVVELKNGKEVAATIVNA
ncbi:MAG: ABC transporter substrate-binding protein [Culicoidibacterales bacterium]